MPSLRRLAYLAKITIIAAGAVGASLLAACERGGSGQNTSCSYRNWRGICQLQKINRTRMTEGFPAVSVLEAVYEPQAEPGGPILLPPTGRREFHVRAEQESELRGHLERNSTIACQFQEHQSGSCSEGNLVMSVPEFAPGPAASAMPDAGAEQTAGCAGLDREPAAQGTAADLPSGVPAEILFEADSAEATSQIEQQAALVAQALHASTDIECVAVIGHITAGERTIVADERASTIKNLLVSRGVAANRLQTIAAVVPMAGGAQRAVIAEDRKVRLRVLRRRP